MIVKVCSLVLALAFVATAVTSLHHNGASLESQQRGSDLDSLVGDLLLTGDASESAATAVARGQRRQGRELLNAASDDPQQQQQQQQQPTAVEHGATATVTAVDPQQQQQQQPGVEGQGAAPAPASAPTPRAPPARKPCSEACYARATCNEELGRCDCPKQHNGPDCVGNTSASHLRYFTQSAEQESERPMPCLNHCNGRGSCVLGECVCQRGFFGADCSVSIGPDGKPVLLEGLGYKPREQRPYIYVYDIPHRYSSWHNPRRMDREALWTIWQRMLPARVLVADGDEADWYFIPVKMRNTADGPKLLKSIEYIRKHWPWYDRHQGHRHFVIHLGDAGRGEVQEDVRRGSENMTWLHHWGLYEDFPYSGWRACHRPGKDIVIPISFRTKASKELLSSSPLHPRAPALPRDGTLMFAGRICGDGMPPLEGKPWPHCHTNKSSGYSQGARQLVHFYHHNRTGYKLVTTSRTYPLDLMRFRWCLAPSGGGHGHRQTLTSIMGCLPLVVSDVVMQPFEPEMDWPSFSLRVAHDDVPGLHSVLEAVTEQRYDKMQDAVRCAAQHLLYSSSKGAFFQEDGRYDAFETVLEILRMQQEYPDLPPSQYIQSDERFRLFMGCGANTMAEAGAAHRAAGRARYPVALADRVYGRDFGWDEMYNKGALVALQKHVVKEAKEEAAAVAAPRGKGRGGGGGDGGGGGAGGTAGGGGGVSSQLPLCSVSKWDRPSDWCNCKAYKDCAEAGVQVTNGV